MDSDDRHDAGGGGVPPIGEAPGETFLTGRHMVLAEYEATMRQFLQTQESVMMAYLSGSTEARRTRPWRSVGERKLAPPTARALPHAVEGPGAPKTPPAPLAPASEGSSGKGGNGSQPPAREAEVPSGAARTGANGTHDQESAATEGAGGNGVAEVPASNGQGELSLAGITDMLLGLVEDRTGYPRDMLGMDQNLEADLGIDSIKRVEIVGALLNALPAAAKSALADAGEALNQQKTLKGITDCLWERLGKMGEGTPNPFELTGVGDVSKEPRARLPRFVMTAHAEPADGVSEEPLPKGVVVVTDDGEGVADALVRLVSDAGGRAVVLDPERLRDPGSIEGALGGLGDDRVAALIHLAPLSNEAVSLDAAPSAWLAQFERNEKLPYLLLRAMADDLREGGRVVLATGLGGHFGRPGGPRAKWSLQGGSVGLAKSLKEEWPDCRVKAVDLDPGADPEANARHLLGEMRLPGGRVEVGYPGGLRTIFRTEAADVDTAAPRRLEPGPDWVVLATGGARGITAEVLRPLAAAGATLVLVGRTPLPGDEDPATAAAGTATDLRRTILDRARCAERPAKPAEIEREIQTILRDREIRANLRDFTEAGATVDYRVADVRDPQAVEGLLEALYREFGRLDGVVHGAGIIEDRLLVDKTPESWSRVVGTKVESALLLARHLRPESLKFLTFFTSVAGRYGNSGQADYATANELLNRLACRLHREWGGRVKVSSINWGPWLATRYGLGMVSEETQRKFEAKGVGLVAPEAGAAFFLDEILRAPMDQVEVIAGEGPWERHEAEMGAFADDGTDSGRVASPEGVAVGGAGPGNGVAHPLLPAAVREPGPKGGFVVRRTLDTNLDLYLDQHRLDGHPVLPAAIAMELMAEAAAEVWPGWSVTEVADLRVLGGLRFENGASREVEIALLGSEHGSAEGFRATVELRSVGGQGRMHYRAAIGLSSEVPDAEAFDWKLAPDPSPLTAHDAYRTLLFHGPCFQTITKLVGLDGDGVVAELSATPTESFVNGAASGANWLFDPGLVDSAPQMALVWSRQMRSEAALPNRFGRVRRYGSAPIGACRMHFALDPSSDAHQVRADVAFVDADGNLRLLIEDMECTSSAELNRLCGYEGEIRV